ncbi:MAG TPA: glycosyltransferase family 1 protein [Vicinamibacterales bacterium]|nr:glycosyltransferase family 1 protein [Vicinamibacterales bacterium]
MRILLDYRSALRRRTGVGEYAHQLASALCRHGSQPRVTLFSSSWKDRLAADAVPGADVLDARIPVSVLNFAWHRLGWPAVEALGAAADVAWSLHPLLMPSSSAAQVATVHDLYFLDHPEATAREVRRDYPALAGAHGRRADAVIANSEYTKQLVTARLGVPGDRVTVCHPGAPAWRVREEPATPGPILHIGTIEPRKNVTALIKAYLMLALERPQTPPLVFAGRIATPVAMADSELYRTRVRFLGYVSDEERLKLYREASMLVIASAEEGFGIPALEGMTIGLPVVAARRGSLPEVLGDAGLLVEADDAAVLARAMGRLLDDPALRREQAARGVSRARLFNWDDSAGRLLEAFHEAIARRRTRS